MTVTPLVIDASVAVKWLVEEADTGAAVALLARDLAAPALLRIEVANALRTAVGKGAMARVRAMALLDRLHAAPVALLPHDDALERRALEVALDLGHPVYDCVYLALAERTGRLLVTADARPLPCRTLRFPLPPRPSRHGRPPRSPAPCPPPPPGRSSSPTRAASTPPSS